MSTTDVSRRHFLIRAGTRVSAVWLTAHWPAILAAADHAHQAARSATPRKFEFFTSTEAKEIDAITARIIPTDDMPGAREAGAVFFIDRALTTFAKGGQKAYREGLPELQAGVHEMFPGTEKFSDATPEQQDALLHSLDSSDASQEAAKTALQPRPAAQALFRIVRAHTVIAFLIDPESGGNRGAVGWKVIGRELDYTFQPPFGYYDKDYQGWQADTKEPNRK